MCVYVYIYICVYIYIVCVYIYIYICAMLCNLYLQFHYEDESSFLVTG